MRASIVVTADPPRHRAASLDEARESRAATHAPSFKLQKERANDDDGT
jgi:hypothetical protein